MPSVEYADDPRELRNFAMLQWVLTAGFLALLFWMLGGTDADYPPPWLSGVLVALIIVGAVFAERAWHSVRPLPADILERDARGVAVGAFAKLTVRKLIFC